MSQQSLKMDVHVTKADIDTAIPKKSNHCMIKDAFQRDFAKKFGYKPTHTTVDMKTIEFTDPKKNTKHVCLTPRIASSNLLLFDHGKSVKEFQFRLESIQAVSKESKITKSVSTKTVTKSVKETKTVTKSKKTSSDAKKATTKRAPKQPVSFALQAGRRREFGLRAIGKTA